MKVLVQIVPPSAGAATSEIFGTEAADTSPRPISSPAASRSAWTARVSAVVRLELGDGLVPAAAELCGGHHHDRHAVVDAGDGHARR